VGSSGAGKSRLINVLLGDAPVLPSAGEGSAVTAATVELRYCAQRPLVAELVWVVSKVAVAWIHHDPSKTSNLIRLLYSLVSLCLHLILSS
jgi:predicted GTPase